MNTDGGTHAVPITIPSAVKALSRTSRPETSTSVDKPWRRITTACLRSARMAAGATCVDTELTRRG